MTRSTYHFFDETDNFDFSHNGTRFFLLACVSMRHPFPVVKRNFIVRMRDRLLKLGNYLKINLSFSWKHLCWGQCLSDPGFFCNGVGWGVVVSRSYGSPGNVTS